MTPRADSAPRGTVLVVDDDRDIVETLSDILELRGWKVVRGYDGAEAVSLALEHDVDWVVMDVRMPHRSGVEAMEEIRRARPSTRVVLMTAFATPEVMERAARAGGTPVLAKPFELAKLLATME
jgi:CheY-like chemotaxis protein